MIIKEIFIKHNLYLPFSISCTHFLEWDSLVSQHGSTIHGINYFLKAISVSATY